MAEMNAAEAAERIKKIHYSMRLPTLEPEDYEALALSESALRKIASGELREVVHGEWLNFYGDFSTAECSECGECYEVSPEEEPKKEFFNEFQQCYKFCPNCGARMDGKDGSDEID